MIQLPDTATTHSYDNAWESTRLAAKDGWILDPQNRVVILHGINVSGGTKMPFHLPSKAATTSRTEAGVGLSTTISPAYYGAASSTANLEPSTHASPSKGEEGKIKSVNVGEVPGVVYSYKDKEFYDHRNVSFVNRPFSLEEADLHFERLARWGCQCLRILVPWEALEHTGPGIYDEEYIMYLIKLLRIAAKYGLKCYLDPHVDCWSRFTGGSGMPGWTLELAGMDMTKFNQTGAAIVHNTYANKEDYPKMIWATNNIKVAAATMFTLFFAGQVFAPQAMVPLTATTLHHLRRMHSAVISDEAYRRGVDGGLKAPAPVQNLVQIPRADHEFVQRGQVNIQHFLQAHYIEAFAHLGQRIEEEDRISLAMGGIGLVTSGTMMGFETMNEPSPGYLNHPDLNKLLELGDLQVGACPTPIQGLELAQGRTVECEVWNTGALGPMRKGSVKINQEKANIWKRPYWRAQSQGGDCNMVGQQRLQSPSAPPLMTAPDGDSSGYDPKVSPFDIISRLGIVNAPPVNAETAAREITVDALSEAHLFKTGWPEPAGYSDVCLWAEHKVWDPKTGKLLQPNYFERIPTKTYVPPGFQPGKEVEWKQDFWLPFVNTFSLRMRQIDSSVMIFVEPPVNEAPPMFRLHKVLIRGAGDQLTNMFKSMLHWRQRQAYHTQHTASVSRRVVTESMPADGNNNDIDKGKGRRIEDDLYDNACQYPIFEPYGDVSDNIVVAPHFYDGYTNITRDFIPFTLDFLGYKRGIYWSVLGALKLSWSGVETAWKDQVKGIESDIRFAMGHQQGILMGETGLPMDMFNKASFKNRYGSPKQAFAMRLLLDAMDSSLLSYTLWNYCSDNSNQWGDRWNGEDFSVWCPPENEFLQSEFPSAVKSSSIAETQLTKASVVLKEIPAELGTGNEQTGFNEGFCWWFCRPKTNVWTTRTAPKRLVIVSTDPSQLNTFEEGSTSPVAIANKAPISAGLESWQDLIPLSMQIERSRLEFYGGLRVGETFIRAYPLAIWGEPILYRFEPGKPISNSQLLSKDHDLAKKKTGDVSSWENRFVIYFNLACDRRRGRDPMQRRRNGTDRNTESSWGPDSPSTDIFLPRFHFPLDSPVGEDQFESLNIVQELQTQQRTDAPTFNGVIRSKNSREKGRWHRLDVQLSDGSFTLQPTRQLLQYWTAPNSKLNIQNDNLAPAAEFYEKVETRIRNLFALGWDGIQGISTTAEQEWIRKLWREMQNGEAVAESFVAPSMFSCLFPWTPYSSPRRERDVATEERKKLKLRELQQKWRDRVGLPAKGAAQCIGCGQLEVMHLHGMRVSLQAWSGYRQ
ncbi:hypothetical protein BGZ51_002594 [Haplosporangium sp. Z 767]|nr:hypothetical protein BGZ50_009349 [Haplosporangium sp. Z 11]KAF9193646.1 hypothetical protein BGZ51_002594 [Haplosporangium sp. Z 767]